MLVARELHKFIGSMVDEFSKGGRDALPESTLQAQYVAIICMLRSVGHVLEKVDCADSQRGLFLEARWPVWKREEVFKSFIEPSRNKLLKEFNSRLRLPGQESVQIAIVGTPMPVRYVNFEAEKLVDEEGRPLLHLFNSALGFWDKALLEVETRFES